MFKIKISKNLEKRLERIIKISGMTQNQIIEEAIRRYLSSEEVKIFFISTIRTAK